MDAITTSPSRYADLRAGSRPSRRVADNMHRYHTKLTHVSPQQPYQPNTSAFAYNPHWSNSRVVPLANPSEDDPRVVMPLSKRELWKTSQRATDQDGGFRLRKHRSDRPDRVLRDRGTTAIKSSLASSTASLPGAEDSNSLAQSLSLSTSATASTDVAAEISFWRGREAADELVNGALRKWKTDRKDRAEKMGWTVVLDGADGEGAVYDSSMAHGDADEDWEVLSA